MDYVEIKPISPIDMLEKDDELVWQIIEKVNKELNDRDKTKSISNKAPWSDFAIIIDVVRKPTEKELSKVEELYKNVGWTKTCVTNRLPNPGIVTKYGTMFKILVQLEYENPNATLNKVED